MKKKGKKYWSKGFYILISVIVVPTLLTILLTAFEDTTNEWMMRIGGNEPAAIKAKRLAGSGELIHSDCARLGMKLEDVLKKCPQPVYRLTEHQTEKPYHFIEKLRNPRGGESDFHLFFHRPHPYRNGGLRSGI